MDSSPEKLCDAILETVDPEQHVGLPLVMVEEEIHIGVEGIIATSYRAEQPQVEESGGFQFRLVLP